MSKYPHQSFGRVLRELRKQAGYDGYGMRRAFIDDLTSNLGEYVAYHAIGEYERGQHMPRYNVVSAWIRTTSTDTEDFVDAYLRLHKAIIEDKEARHGQIREKAHRMRGMAVERVSPESSRLVGECHRCAPRGA